MEWFLLLSLVGVGIVATFYLMAKASKGYDKAKARREAGAPLRVCSTCGSPMEFSGLRELEQAKDSVVPEIEVGPLSLEMYQCPTCRKVEFFLPPVAIE